MIKVTDVINLIDSLTEDQWKELYLAHARGDRNNIVPFPKEEIQIITNSQKGEITASGAISILDTVMSCVNEVSPPTKNMRILDYGCGWGRMTRLLPFYFNIDCISGVDVDERLIDSANKLIPYINHLKIKSMKALPFEDASFDIVFANSVFSHLSEKSFLFTLTELSRILKKDGGILIISVLQQDQMNKYYSNKMQIDWITDILGTQKKATSELQKKGFVWGSTGRWNEYGIAVMTDNWISKHFDAVGIQYLNTKYGLHRGTQNYKFGTRV